MNGELPNGVFAASLTPLRHDLCIDHALYAKHVRWLLRHGCNGVALMGATGEATSFSVVERQEALERLLEGGAPRDRLMVGTGCAALPDIIALSRHAVQCGIRHILVLPPFYYKKPSDSGLFAALDALVQALGGAKLKVYLYHFPQMSAVPFSNRLVGRLLSAHPDMIAGMKDSSGDIAHMQEVLRSYPVLRFFAGTEQLLTDVLPAGAKGCVSATVNITCGLTQEVYRTWRTGNVTRLTQQIAIMRMTVETMPVIPALKAVMAELSGMPEWKYVRPPFTPLAAHHDCIVQSLAY